MPPKAYRQLRFGDWALKLGFMTQDDLKYILSKKNISKQMIGQLCLEEGLIDQEDLAQIMAAQFSYRYVKLDGTIPEPLANLVPIDLMMRYKFVPYRKSGEQLIIAMAEPKNLLKLVDELEMLTDMEVSAVVASERNIKTAISRLKTSRSMIDSPTDDMRLSVVRESDQGEYTLSAEKVSAEESPIVKLVDSTILDAINKKASDIHIETTAKGIIIRYRINGMLHQATNPIDAKHQSPIISRIKVMSELDISEKRIPQDGRFKLNVSDRFIDFRISILPTIFGEDAVIRILDRESIAGRHGTFQLDSMGFAEYERLRIRRMIHAPYGMFLMTGPTGSGKTTTLYGALSEINSKDTKIITIEDPVEYQLDGIVQIPVNEKKGLTFAKGLRSILRHDPDKILVGEIRDQETALEAIRASQTGHVVLSTLHCNDAVDSLQRLYDLGIHPNSIAGELLAVIAQRLAKRICKHCRQPAEPDPVILSEVFPDGPPADFRCFEGAGCDKCSGRGTQGRVAIVEYMEVDSDIRNAISSQPPIGELRWRALDAGLVTMRDSALDHVIEGIIPLSELPRILPRERMAPEVRGGRRSQQ